MVDVDQGNVYITTGTLNGNPVTTITSGTTVHINLTEKVDHILINAVGFLPIPVSKGNRGAIQPFSRAIDLKTINETLAVTGFLAEEETERAITKKNNLIKFAKEGGELKVVWGLGNYQTVWKPSNEPKVSGDTGGFITKLQFTETAGKGAPEILGDVHLTDVSTDQAFVRRAIGVILSLGRGKDL